MIQKIKNSYAALLTRRTLIIWVVVSVWAAAAGPFGTYDTQNFWLRLAFWTAVIVCSSLLGHLCHRAAKKLLPRQGPIPIDLLTVALMTATFTPILKGLTDYLYLSNPNAGGPTLIELSQYVAIITLGICVFRRVLPGFETVGYFDREQSENKSTPRLARRLPEDFDPTIVRLSVRDHFVEVVNMTETCTLRMRFIDAIGEMDPVIGFCTHRSHWVAKSAVACVERCQGRIQLRLINGDLVPVSRKYKPDVEAAGIF
jgi:hypothetical protein